MHKTTYAERRSGEDRRRNRRRSFVRAMISQLKPSTDRRRRQRRTLYIRRDTYTIYLPDRV